MKNVIKKNKISIVNKKEYIEQLSKLKKKYKKEIPENELNKLHIITKVETIIESNPNKVGM